MLEEFLAKTEIEEELFLFLLDKTVGITNDERMLDAMKLLLYHGGRDFLKRNTEFRYNLMKKAQMHENQFVVIYEDWRAAEAYLNVYTLLEDIDETIKR